MSGISIMASLAMLAGSAFAAFTTQAVASGNTFSTGTDNLLLSPDNNNDYASSIINPFTGVNIGPGFTKTYTFYLKNDNTNSTDNLDVTASFANGSGDSVLEDALTTQFTCVDPQNGTTTAPAFSVTSMLNGQVSLGTINSGEIATCTLTVSLPSSTDTTLQGKNVSFNVDFNGATSVSPTPTP